MKKIMRIIIYIYFLKTEKNEKRNEKKIRKRRGKLNPVPPRQPPSRHDSPGRRVPANRI